ncbi:hypothetical protein [Acinetobacter towneri]|uniref:hypothetical protein n=1 Tax=Acinetobacter towneri TaxID=202956 RepID=UPI003A8BECAC
MGIYIELNNFEAPRRLIFLKAEIKYGAPDYKKMIEELKEHHEMTAEKIAFVLPVSNASTVSQWARGGRPNYEVGEAFIELWKLFTDKDDKDIPRNNHWSL